jgi:hypothetical protein
VEVMKSFIFCDIKTYSGALIDVCFMLISFFAYPSTIKMRAHISSKYQLTFHRLHGVYIPEGRTPHLNIIACFVYLFNIYLGQRQ